MIEKILAVPLMILCYALLIFRRRLRTSSAYIACGIALVMIVFGIVLDFFGPAKAIESINLNVLAIFWGAMNISHVFAASGAPAWIGERALRHVRTQVGAVIVLAAIAAVISAFVENIATLVILIPIARDVAKKTNSSLIPYVVSMSVAATMEGAVTMVGDSQSIIFALYTGMSFNDYFWFGREGKPGIALLFIIATIAGFILLRYMLKDMNKPLVLRKERYEKLDIKPTLLLISFILAMALSNPLGVPIWVIGLCAGFIALIMSGNMKGAIRAFDWETLLFMIGIFVIVGGLSSSGILDDVADGIAALSMDNKFIAVSIIVWFSVLASAFIDNVPYVTMMIPVCTSTALGIGTNPWLLLFGMMIGAILGGNITPIGTSANIAAYSILEREGEPITFGRFTRISIPITMISVMAAFLALLFLWG